MSTNIKILETFSEDEQKTSNLNNTKNYIEDETKKIFIGYCFMYRLKGKVECNDTLATLAYLIYNKNFESNVNELLEAVDDAIRAVLKPLRKRIPSEGYGNITTDLCDELAYLYDITYTFGEPGCKTNF